MKQLIEIAKKNIIKAAKSCHDSPANFWQTAAITTISAYHLAQIAIIGINKDTPKKEKAFLIPQEAMDGVLNLATFVVFAASFKKLGRNLVKKEIIIPFKKDKKVFTEEFATTANLFGSLLAVNYVSPIIRNKFGADVQKKFMQKQDKPNQPPTVKPKKNIAPAFTAFTNYSSRLKV